MFFEVFLNDCINNFCFFFFEKNFIGLVDMSVAVVGNLDDISLHSIVDSSSGSSYNFGDFRVLYDFDWYTYQKCYDKNIFLLKELNFFANIFRFDFLFNFKLEFLFHDFRDFFGMDISNRSFFWKSDENFKNLNKVLQNGEARFVFKNIFSGSNHLLFHSDNYLWSNYSIYINNYYELNNKLSDFGVRPDRGALSPNLNFYWRELLTTYIREISQFYGYDLNALLHNKNFIHFIDQQAYYINSNFVYDMSNHNNNIFKFFRESENRLKLFLFYKQLPYEAGFNFLVNKGYLLPLNMKMESSLRFENLNYFFFDNLFTMKKGFSNYLENFFFKHDFNIIEEDYPVYRDIYERKNYLHGLNRYFRNFSGRIPNVYSLNNFINSDIDVNFFIKDIEFRLKERELLNNLLFVSKSNLNRILLNYENLKILDLDFKDHFYFDFWVRSNISDEIFMIKIDNEIWFMDFRSGFFKDSFVWLKYIGQFNENIKLEEPLFLYDHSDQIYYIHCNALDYFKNIIVFEDFDFFPGFSDFEYLGVQGIVDDEDVFIDEMVIKDFNKV